MTGAATTTLTVGVIGHVDHGKTALVRALTGVETDRLAEEKARGISIALGFAPLRTDRGTIDLIDMPGHERFVRTMVSGATGIGALLLVIDAVEGARPQTHEHLTIARALGIDRGVVALAKCDLVTADARASAITAARTLARGAGLKEPVIVATSARTGEGIQALNAALADLAGSGSRPADHGFFWLPIDRVFAVAGFGTVVTGTLRRGRLAVGDRVEILAARDPAEPHPSARVRGLQVHGASVESAGPGRRLAVNLRGVDAAALAPGDALATPGVLGVAAWADVVLTMARDAPPLANGAAVQFLLGTAEFPARVRLLDRDEIGAGEEAVAQLRLPHATALPAREPFILRQPSPAATLGGGRLLGPAPHRRRRGEPHGLQLLTTLAAASLAPPPGSEAVTALLADAGEAGTSLQALARTLGLLPDAVKPAIETAGGVLLGRDLVMDGAGFDALAHRLSAAVSAFQTAEPLAAGIGAAALRAGAAPDTSAEMLEVVLARLVAERQLQRAGLLFRLQAPADRVAGSPEQRAVAAVAEGFRAGGLAPPDLSAIAGSDPLRGKAVHHLVRTGTLVRTTDLVQKREVIFHAGAIAEAHRRLAAAFPAGAPFLVKEAGQALGISRKYSVPLLEHLDRLHLTRRDGDRRTVLPRRTAE